MDRHGLRFVHAAALRLGTPIAAPDHPAGGGGSVASGTAAASPSVGGAAALRSDAATSILESASAVAFRNLVQAAVDRDVDFVLLHGDAFRERDRSVAARVALVEGLDSLGVRGIPVVVVPGVEDPVAAWDQLPGLPDGVSVLDPSAGDEPVEIDRDGEAIARVWAIAPQARLWPAPRGDRNGALRMGVLCESSSDRAASRRLVDGGRDAEAFVGDRIESFFRRASEPLSGYGEALPWDYVAVPVRRGRRTAAVEGALVHSPGALQGIALDEVGLHGGSLVSWTPGRPATCELLPLSPVVQHRIELTVDESSTEDRLIDAMRAAIGRFERHPAMELLVCRWTIRGRGPLVQSLADPDFQSLLVDAAAPEGAGFALAHSIRLSPDADWRSRRGRGSAADLLPIAGPNGPARFLEHAAAVLSDESEDEADLVPAAIDALGDAGLARALATVATVDRSGSADGAFRLLDEWLSSGLVRVSP